MSLVAHRGHRLLLFSAVLRTCIVLFGNIVWLCVSVFCGLVAVCGCVLDGGLRVRVANAGGSPSTRVVWVMTRLARLDSQFSERSVDSMSEGQTYDV